MYSIRACGYCPKLHMCPSGHKVQMQRNGQHDGSLLFLMTLLHPNKFGMFLTPTMGAEELLQTGFCSRRNMCSYWCLCAGAVQSNYEVGCETSTNVREAETVV